MNIHWSQPIGGQFPEVLCLWREYNIIFSWKLGVDCNLCDLFWALANFCRRSSFETVGFKIKIWTTRQSCASQSIANKKHLAQRMSKNPRDVMVKLLGKVQRLAKLKNIFENIEIRNDLCTQGRSLCKLFNEISPNLIARQKLFSNSC